MTRKGTIRFAKQQLAQAVHLRVPLANVRPNDWNMNKMPPALREKLVHGIKDLHAKTGHLPPIVVRPHPTESGAYQIIDGFHRWDVLRTEEIDTDIDAFVVDVDTKTAMILTETLNYLRGEPDPTLHVKFYQALNAEHGMPVTEIAEFVPHTADEIVNLFDAYDIQIVNVEVPADQTTVDDAAAPSDDDLWVELKFNVSKSQMDVIEAELSRIGSFLTGKNVRGRALEFMAVNSSQTDIENLTGEPPEVQDDDAPRANLKRLKAKLRAVAAASPKTKTKKAAS